MDKELKKEISYHNFVNENNIAFEIIKSQNKSIKILTTSLVGIILIIIGSFTWLFSNYDVSVTTHTTEESVDVGGDFTQYNDNSINNTGS